MKRRYTSESPSTTSSPTTSPLLSAGPPVKRRQMKRRAPPLSLSASHHHHHHHHHPRETSSSPTSSLLSTPRPISRYSSSPSPSPSSFSPQKPTNTYHSDSTYYCPPWHPYPTPPPSPPRTPSPSSSSPSTPFTPSSSNPTHTHPTLTQTLHHLRTPLHPLISSTTGRSHPDFPSSLLTYHLLTSTQLDNLARHFHQIHPPVRPTYWYPITIPPWLGTENEDAVDLETKRRRFGRFIGLRGCESPIRRGFMSSRERIGEGLGIRRFRDVEGDVLSDGYGDGDGDDIGDIGDEEGDGDGEDESPEEMLERMEREWTLGLLRARYEGDVAMRWKFGRE